MSVNTTSHFRFNFKAALTLLKWRGNIPVLWLANLHKPSQVILVYTDAAYFTQYWVKLLIIVQVLWHITLNVHGCKAVISPCQIKLTFFFFNCEWVFTDDTKKICVIKKIKNKKKNLLTLQQPNTMSNWPSYFNESFKKT